MTDDQNKIDPDAAQLLEQAMTTGFVELPKGGGKIVKAFDPEAKAEDLQSAFRVMAEIRREERLGFIELLRKRGTDARRDPRAAWHFIQFAQELEREWGFTK